jgi:hypothetical protein
MPAVFAEVIARIPGSGGRLLKVGRDVRGLLRPDKIVIYFARFDDALRFARELAADVGVVRPQGVPFTHQVGRTALVSVALDPPAHVYSPGTAETQSWRTWLTERLAECILQVRRLGPSDFRRSVATEIAALGVDPETWRPFGVRWYDESAV